jgi:hypothetical protein
MTRVVLVRGDAIGRQEIRDALDALPGEMEAAGDLGDGRGAALDRGHDLPAGARLPGRPSQGVARGTEQPVQLEDADPELAQCVTGRRSTALRASFSVDSILSI